MNTYVVTVHGDTSFVHAQVESVREFQARYVAREDAANTLVIEAPNRTEALRQALRAMASS